MYHKSECIIEQLKKCVQCMAGGIILSKVLCSYSMLEMNGCFL